jgi:DNA-binding NarL/FixJ family response regulator
VAEQTVKFHLTNIYRKLGVSNRTEAARLAYQNGLVESPIDDG